MRGSTALATTTATFRTEDHDAAESQPLARPRGLARRASHSDALS